MSPEYLAKRSLTELFALADEIGNKKYHELTAQDFEDYLQYDYWRYVNTNSEHKSTDVSRQWVRDHSDHFCPVCSENYRDRGGRTIDHKLPRSQYPWLSIEFSNLWVICQECNFEKADMNWYEYEHFVYLNYPDDYAVIRAARPQKLLDSLKNNSPAKGS